MDILTHPNPALRQVACEVQPDADPEIISLVKQMARAMYDAPGIGLAAPQLGVLKRVVIYDLDEEGIIALCNPEIVSRSDEIVMEEEGCLSLPNISIPIERSLNVTCTALDLKGQPVRIEAEGLHARLLQHEVDHLDGVLVMDRATPEERKAALKRYLEAQKDDL